LVAVPINFAAAPESIHRAKRGRAMIVQDALLESIGPRARTVVIARDAWALGGATAGWRGYESSCARRSARACGGGGGVRPTLA